MPTYDYKCPDCGRETEVTHRISDDITVECKKCGAEMEKQLSSCVIRWNTDCPSASGGNK